MRTRATTAAVLAVLLAITAGGCASSPERTETTTGRAIPMPTYPVETDPVVGDSPTYQEMTRRGTVRVGVRDDQPYLGDRDAAGEPTGFDIEIAKMVAAELGFGPDQIEFVTVLSAEREEALRSRRVDYVVATYTITEERKKSVSFVGPYLVAGQDLLVRAGEESSVSGPEDLAGRRVCSARGSTPIQRIRQEYPDLVAVEADKYSQCVEQLLAGEVDAVTTDDAILQGYAAQRLDKLRVIGKPFSSEPYGIGVPKDDEAFRQAVAEALQLHIDNGDWARAHAATLGMSGAQPPTPPQLQP